MSQPDHSEAPFDALRPVLSVPQSHWVFSACNSAGVGFALHCDWSCRRLGGPILRRALWQVLGGAGILCCQSSPTPSIELWKPDWGVSKPTQSLLPHVYDKLQKVGGELYWATLSFSMFYKIPGFPLTVFWNMNQKSDVLLDKAGVEPAGRSSVFYPFPWWILPTLLIWIT